MSLRQLWTHCAQRKYSEFFKVCEVINSYTDRAVEVLIAIAWGIGLLSGIFGTETGERVVGMLLWIGLGAGYRLRKIQEHSEAIRAHIDKISSRE